VRTVQTQLRTAFGRWGRPQRFRVDNGAPWGSWSDLPTDLALWLIGLDIAMIWNPPRTPQDNGVVERSQGTGKRWAEPRACRNAAELQKRLTVMDQIQREDYPVQGDRSRLALYPQLQHSGRPYTEAWEAANWSMDQAIAHLTEYVVTRRVDKTGQVSLYNRNHYVGVMHAGKTVYVMFDPEQHAWVFADEDQHELRRKPAAYLSQASITGLEITHHATK
jgi:transposase InsO family protein